MMVLEPILWIYFLTYISSTGLRKEEGRGGEGKSSVKIKNEIF